MLENNKFEKKYEVEVKKIDKVDNFRKKNNIKYNIVKFSLDIVGDTNGK